jgi:hypothetical protein
MLDNFLIIVENTIRSLEANNSDHGALTQLKDV